MSNIKNRKEGGFTIIEVLIVLAIAGLIMLIVFLAVPALQRSSRNTQRKNDASALASAAANYMDNNGGGLPGNVGGSGNTVLVCGADCTSGNTESAKLGYYKPANVAFQTAGTTPTADTDKLILIQGYKCNDTNTGVGTASSRANAVIFFIETGSSTTATQCVGS